MNIVYTSVIGNCTAYWTHWVTHVYEDEITYFVKKDAVPLKSLLYVCNRENSISKACKACIIMAGYYLISPGGQRCIVNCDSACNKQYQH